MNISKGTDFHTLFMKKIVLNVYGHALGNALVMVIAFLISFKSMIGILLILRKIEEVMIILEIGLDI